MNWNGIGKVLPKTLTDARLQLHWAAQLVSAPGNSLLTAKTDFSHTNLEWDVRRGVLKGRAVGSEPVSAAVAFEGLELMLLGPSRERSLRLVGNTMAQALAWLGREICDDADALALPKHDMPQHPLAAGGEFSDATAATARSEIGAWFANATEAIREVVAQEPNASAVRCWPHHFDVGSLLALESNGGGETARSIGVGLSPGDGFYDQPYFYVTPWPYPVQEALPVLSRGAIWHTRGWTGIVRTADTITSLSPDERHEAVLGTLHGAIATCRELFEG